MTILKNESGFELEEVKVVEVDLPIPKVSKIMYEMDHPYLFFQDRVTSPFDICMALKSGDMLWY